MAMTVIGYIGPETISPVVSALVAVGGAMLMMGQSGIAFVKGCALRLVGRREISAEVPERTDAK